MITAQPLAIRRTYTPLSGKFGLTVSSGSTSQFYHTTAGTYIPNRILVPLVLSPILTIVDPDSILSGDKSAELEVNWYENSLSSPITSGTDYVISGKKLYVHKNVAFDKPLQIICRATYTDTRNGKQFVGEDAVTLSTMTQTDETLSVSLDKDVATLYNPLSDNELIRIKASAYLGGNPLSSNVAYWWYKVSGTKETLVGDGLDIEYVSGQHTDTLVVNALNANDVQYRLRVAYYDTTPPSAPTDSKVFADTTLKWDVPKLRSEIYSPMGNALRTAMKEMTFRCLIFTAAGQVSNIEKYFFIKWFTKTTAAGATPVEVGHGESITLSAAQLTSPGNQVLVYPEIKLLYNYQAAGDETGAALKDSDGKILLIR